MKEKGASNLRRKAEKLLVMDGESVENLNLGELKNLVHELAVHQVELEIQNEELSKSRLELEDALERYSKLYDLAPIAYFTLGYQNYIKEVNLTGASLLGIVRSQLIGKRFTQYVAPDNINDFYFWRKKAIETAKRETCELRMKKTDGTTFYAYLDGTAETDKKLRVAVVDITELKMAEEKLLESERRFRIMFEGHQAIMLLIDPENGKIVNANPAAAKFYGYPREVLCNMDVRTINQLDDVQISQTMQSALTNEMNRFVFPHRLASGEIRSVEVHSTPININNRPILFSIIHDVTDRKLAEEQEAYLATFPLLTPSQIVELNLKGEIIYLNPAAKSLFPGLDNGMNVMHHAFFSAVVPLFKVFRRGKKKLANCEVEVENRWYQQSVHNLDGRVRIYSNDITEIKRAGELKDEFIGMVSHELKTPMTVIIGALSTLCLEGISQKDANQLLNDAVINGYSMANMIENLLELSRDQAQRLILEIKPTDVEEIIRKVVQKLTQKSSRHWFKVDIKMLPVVQVDPVRVERILYNLIDNAIKYSPDGGEIDVFAVQQDDKILIGVRDYGIGIDRKDMDKLFQRFQRLVNIDKYSIQGVGLGLRVCKILVEAMGGRIWVESVPQRGSSFFFTIPIGNSGIKARS